MSEHDERGAQEAEQVRVERALTEALRPRSLGPEALETHSCAGTRTSGARPNLPLSRSRVPFVGGDGCRWRQRWVLVTARSATVLAARR